MSETLPPAQSLGTGIQLYYAGRGYVLAGFLMALLFARSVSNAPLSFSWLWLIGAGATLRIWAGLYIGSHSNGIKMQAGPRACNGPYRWVHHPLYLSNGMVSIGLIGFAHCLSLRTALGLAWVVLAHHGMLIFWENRILQASRESKQEWNSIPVWSWQILIARQGRNLAYTFLSVILVVLVAGKSWHSP